MTPKARKSDSPTSTAPIFDPEGSPLSKEVGNKPFLPVVSYLEPHQQNDWGRFAAPDSYSEKFSEPFPARVVPIPRRLAKRIARLLRLRRSA